MKFVIINSVIEQAKNILKIIKRIAFIIENL